MPSSRSSAEFIRPNHSVRALARWQALLDAALDQPNPSPALLAAMEGLKRRDRGGCKHGTRPPELCYLCREEKP